MYNENENIWKDIINKITNLIIKEDGIQDMMDIYLTKSIKIFVNLKLSENDNHIQTTNDNVESKYFTALINDKVLNYRIYYETGGFYENLYYTDFDGVTYLYNIGNIPKDILENVTDGSLIIYTSKKILDDNTNETIIFGNVGEILLRANKKNPDAQDNNEEDKYQYTLNNNEGDEYQDEINIEKD